LHGTKIFPLIYVFFITVMNILKQCETRKAAKRRLS
jgi:hypothetical protein